jgi:hypothetical protein
LQWLYCFSRNERWKEEVLIVAEEIRRVGAWYKNRMIKAEAAVEAAGQGTNQFSEDWIHRGFKSLLNQRKMETKKEYDALPLLMKEGSGFA